MVLKRLQINMNALTCVLMMLGILPAVIASDTSNCDIYDTVDLTGIQEKNGSYLYKNVEIPRNKIGEYNYTAALFSDFKPADNHVRGCLCQVAKCVYFCCEPEQDLPNVFVNMSLSGSDFYVNALDQEYVVQAKYRLSCDTFYVKEKDESFTIQENGTMTSYTKNKEYSKKEYCLVPVRINDTYYELWPATNKIEHVVQTETKISFSDVLRSVSVFCMIMTISVYIYLPKFRTDYSNSCLCYFICLTVSFTLIWVESNCRSHVPYKSVCYLIGYCGYYMVMATFLWLFIINYNLWRRVTTLQNRSSGMFRRYNIFVWSVAAILLAITGTIELLTLPKEENGEIEYNPWSPGVALYYCWINTESWSAMLYYYGPVLVMVITIIVLSIITAKRIYVENKESRSNWKTAESQTNVTNQANLSMFFRLFAISGVVWITEIISFLFSLNTSGISNYIDYIPCSQGILLFFVTIWKNDVLKAVYERMSKKANNRNSRAICSTSDNDAPLSSKCTEA